ncbi:hypothetical protein KI387_035287 [Taxus chinensis]|uniref:Uncharacterized protein n=1 Tax=Taxus chinensis TaxID=29808 RepID=A0AA38FP20_TAXCH|nr:hypothetical protein KI387_035287 [Taxus chinensis]
MKLCLDANLFMDKLELNLLSLEGNGDPVLEETMDGSPEIQTGSSPFEAFSIRNYVAGVRKVAIKKCWPFSPQFLETKLQKGVHNVLPPLEVLTCRYWGCADCVESAVNDNPDKENQRNNAGTQLDAPQSDPAIQNAGNIFTRKLEKGKKISDNMETSDVEDMPKDILKKDEAGQKEVTSHVSADIESEEASLVCSERTFLSRDDGAEDTTIVKLGVNEILVNLTEDALDESQNGGNVFTRDLKKEEYFSDDMETSDVEAMPEDILKKDEAGQKKLTSHVLADTGSEEAPLVCNERTLHSRNHGAEDTKTAQLGVNEILLNLTEDAFHDSQNVGNIFTREPEKEEYFSDDMDISDAETMSGDILKQDEADQNKVISHVSADIGLEEAPLVFNERAFCSRDDGAEDTTTAQVGANEILLNLTEDTLHESHSGSKTVICKVTSRPIDFEPSVPTCQSVCGNSKEQVFDNEVATEMTAEAYMLGSNVTVKAEVLLHASATKDFMENNRTVHRSHHKNEDGKATETGRHHIINDNPNNTPVTSIFGHNIDLDDCQTQLSSEMGNGEPILKRDKTESKQQKENRKTQKKRFIADLIASAPSKQSRGDGEDQNWASENTSRKARIGTWKQKSLRSQKCFKDTMHGLKELNGKRKVISEVPCASILTNFVPEKSHSESLEMTSKRQRLGVAVHSSSSKKIKEEARSLDEKELITNSLERPPTDDLARSLMKKKLVQHFISDEIQKTKTSVESDDDLMDLAGFLAQKQLERISSLPSFGLPKGKRFRRFKRYPIQQKTNNVLRHKTEQLSDQVPLKPSSSSKEDLVARQDAFRNSPDQVVSENGHPRLLVEQRRQQLAQLYNSLVPEVLDVSRQGEKEGTGTAKRDQTRSVSKDHSNRGRKAREKNIGHESKSAAPVMMAQKIYKGYSTSRRKKSVSRGLKKSITSPEHDHGRIPSQVVSENGNLYLSAESRCQQINQLPDSYMQEKSIISEQNKEMRTGPDSPQKPDIIVQDGEIDLGHRSEGTSLFTRKGRNNKRYGASKRLKSAAQKFLKKPKLSLKPDLAEEQNTSTYRMVEEVPHGDHMHLESGGCQERHQIEVSLMSQGLNASVQAREARKISGRNEVFSSSNDYFDNRRKATVKTSGHRRKIASFVAMKRTKKKGSSASQCKPTAASKSCYGTASGSEYLSDTIPKTGKGDILLRSELASSAAIKRGKGSSSKKKKSGTYKSTDGTNLSPNQGIRRQTTLNCNLIGDGSEDAQADPIAGEGQQMNPDEAHFVPDNTVTAGGDDGAGTFSEIRDEVIRDCLDIPIRMGEKKSAYKHNVGSCVLVRKQNNKGSSRSQRKKSTGHTSMKELQAVAKAAGRQMSIIEETNAALNAAFSDGNGSKPRFSCTVIRGNGYCPERNLNSRTCKFIPSETIKAVTGKGFIPHETLIPPSVAPTFKDRELVIINDNSVQLTLNSGGFLADSSQVHNKTLDLEKSNKKDNNLNQRTNGRKSESPKVVYASVHEPEAEPRHPSVDIFTKQAMQSIDGKFSTRHADAELGIKNQDALERGNSLMQCHGNALSNGIEKQSSSNATCLPVKGFLGQKLSHHVPNGSGSCNFLGCHLPYATLATPAVESAPEVDQCRSSSLPSNCSNVFGSAQGNRVNIPAKSSQETYHGKYDLNSYIEERIKAHRTNWASGYEGSKRNASATMDTSARKLSEPEKTIAKNRPGSSSLRTRTGFEALDLDALKQNLAETTRSPGKAETKQRIERSPYINVFTNTSQVPHDNQDMQSTILPLIKNDFVAKIQDSTSMRTLQSECVEPEDVANLKNLKLGLAPNVLKHQNFGRKPAMVTRNVTDLIETETWEADSTKHRISCMHDSGKAVLTSQSHASLRPTPLKPLKLAPGCKHYLNMPAQKTKQHTTIHSIFPSIQGSMGGKCFQDGLIAFTDQYGRLVRTSDKPFQMEARAHSNFSDASESVLAASTQENMRIDVTKDLYVRADINCFPGPAVRVDEVSGGASDKEGSVLTSLSKDNQLELSLSIQQASETVKRFK